MGNWNSHRCLNYISILFSVSLSLTHTGLKKKSCCKTRIFMPLLYKKLRAKNLHLPSHLCVTFLGFDVIQQNDSSYLIKQISGLAPAVGRAISSCESKKGCNPWPIDHFCMEICFYSKPCTGHWKWIFFSYMNYLQCAAAPRSPTILTLWKEPERLRAWSVPLLYLFKSKKALPACWYTQHFFVFCKRHYRCGLLFHAFFFFSWRMRLSRWV